MDDKVSCYGDRLKPVEGINMVSKNSKSSKDESAVKAENLGKNIIFLISQPRAGSTLLQRLLAGHQDMHTTAEPWLMLHPLYALKEKGIETEYGADTAQQGLVDFLKQVPEGIELYKDAIRKLGSTLYNRAVELSGKKYFLDKTPRYYHIIPELYSIFPDAKFIILLRHPLAVLSSVLKTWFDNRVDKIQPPNVVDLVKGPVCLVNGIENLKERAIVVGYEALVQYPEKVMTELCTRIGIPYDQDMLNYGIKPKPKGRFGDQVSINQHNRPVSEYVNKWQKNFSTIELVEYAEQYIKTLGADIIVKLGYNFDDIIEKLGIQRKWCLNLEKISEEVKCINKDVKNLTDRGFILEADKLLKKAYKMTPNDGETNNNLGCVFYQKGETKKALFHFLKAVEYSPEKIEFQKNLANFFYKTGKIESSVENYLKIYKKNPEDFDVITSLAEIYIDIGNYNESFGFCQKALDKYPHRTEIRELFLNLGQKLQISGDLNKTREVYLYYLSRNSEDEVITRKWLKSKDNVKDKDIIKKVAARNSDYKISAIVSTYNSEEFIRECVENLETQTINKDIEIVVVDADSEQNEENIVNEFQARFSNITYIKTRKRVGIYTAWNIGVKEATGKYIITASTNDSLKSDACEILSAFLDENPSCILVYGDTYLTKTPHQSYHHNTHDDEYRWPQYYFREHLEKCLVGPHPMWRKEIHSEIGFFDERYITVGDQEFWLRIGERYKITHIPEFTGLQWITDNAISRKGLLPELEIKHIQSTYQKRFALKNSNQNVLCSIIIPVFNQLEYTKKCLEALNKNTPNKICEIIIVDNNSTDGTSKYLTKNYPDIIYIKNTSNLGFSKACNQGAQAANYEYLLFLNNDTEVQPDWLEPLLKIADSDFEVAAVGSKLLFPDRTIQHAGVVVIKNKEISETINATHIYYGQKEDFTEANKTRCYQVLTAACLLIRKKYFENVKGFDEQYWNGYEDVDLCFKLHEKGWKLIYQPESVVIHHESKSGKERFSKTQQNIDLLNQKWIGKITPDLILEKDGTISATKSHNVREYIFKNDRYTIKHEPKQNIKVSIIILTLNQVEYTSKCIESINSHTAVPYEIIVVDNGSTDGTLGYLHSLKKKNKYRKALTIIENKKNLGFAGGNNVGLGISNGSYVLMMNNDIVVTPGWLDRLIDCAEKSPTIGIVGPRSNQVSGPQLVEKVKYNEKTLKGLNRFSEEFTKDNYEKSHRTLRVVGFCMLVKRFVIDKIGGMDDRFGRGNFEDDDFSIRAALAGYESWIVEDCFVHHFGSRTFIGEKIDYNESLNINWEIFKGKWGLPSNLEYGSPYSLSQMKLSGFDPRIHYIPLPNDGGDHNLNRTVEVSAAEQEYQEICSGIDKNDLNSAIDRMQDFVSKYADFAIAYNDLGVLFYQNGDKESALKNYQKAVSLDSQNITLQKNLADFLYVEGGMVEEALNIYVKILSTNPKDLETLLITGHICVALEQFEDAASFYEKVLEIEPTNSDACQHLEILMKKLSAPQNSLLTETATDAPGAVNKRSSHSFPATGMTGEIATERTQVSIIMLLDGPHDAMQKSYASVRENTNATYELFFIENGAGQKVREWIQKTLNNDKYQCSNYIEQGSSIAEKLYHAIELTRGEHIVIIRDNILVSEHWLTGMIDTLRLSQNAGIVGPFSTRHSGTCMHATPINENTFRDYAREFRARNRHRRIPMRLFDSSCLIFQRKLANVVSSGDPQYIGVEALVKDFCQRVSEAGFQNMIAGDVLVHHLNYGAKLIGVANQKKNGDKSYSPFHEKWDGLMTGYSYVGEIEIQTLLEKADCLFQKGQVEAGIEVLLEGIGRFPEVDYIYVTLAEQLINSGRYQDALDALSEIPVDANKGKKTEEYQSGKIRLLKAYCEEGLGNYEIAAELVDQVLRLHPDNPKALNLKGILVYRKDEKHRARECFQRAIDADPGYGEPHTNLGSLLWETGDAYEALNLFERGFILTPTGTDIATAYHEAVSTLNEFTRAEPIVRETLEPYPYNRKLQYMLIDVLNQTGQLNEALTQIEKAISISGIEDGVLDAALNIRKQIGPVEIRKKTKKKPSVSLCMIVKNEEKFLPQCLASLKPIVDEIIVVDTGSTDRTKDIATVYGAQVFGFNWNDDFAAARNFSIAKARGEWILIMDADEVISPMDYTAFRKLINKKSLDPSAYSIVTRNYCHKANTIGWNPNDGYYAQEENGIGWLPSEKVRLFSNNNGIKFEGAVHEMADPILKRKGIKIKKSKIPVHHYGRLNTEQLGQKGQAYYEIGRKKLVEGGEDISAVRELAIQATILEKNSEAIELWEKFLSMKPDHGAVPEAYVNMGTVYIRLKDYHNALIFAQKAVALYPEMKEAQYNLGMAELYNGKPDDAVNTLKRLLNSYPDFPPARFLLVASKCCSEDSSDRNGEIKELKQGSFGPVLTYSVSELAEGLMAAGQDKIALNLLKNAIGEEIVSKDIMILYTVCLGKIKDSMRFDSNIPDETDVRTESIAPLI